MRKYIFIISSVLYITTSYAQHFMVQPDELMRIKQEDSLKLMGIPPLDVPEAYTKGLMSLPAVVDNSTQPYFRPITWQSGYECGQTAGIAFVFTYEINRLRGLSATLPQNQYHTHFSWNFLNNAHNYTGVSFFDTWEITRTCGNPNIAEYGALYSVNERYWMSGYPKYYNGMKNRIKGVYGIRCDSPEGINALKGWIYDHLEGASSGGVCAFYGQYCSPNTTLPAGTPQGGQALISTWGASPSHAWTVAGYNDSIRYDYNNDGQYTNHIDINDDGIVDVRDWEIGGVKIANGYAGTGWGNGGFSYVMYKSLADGISNGGIWNATVYVVKAKETQEPKITFKIDLKHNVRNQIKVLVGVSQNASASTPDVRMEFPIFNFQGSTHYMQGDSTEAGKNIEFGLDVTPLLSYISSGQPARFFLEVIEKDPNGTGTGQINSFSLMDYTLGNNETAYATPNVPLINNDTTRIFVNRTILFSAPTISTDTLSAKINDNFSQQLQAQSGAAPYLWRLKMNYAETLTPETFPATQQQVLSTGNSGSVIQNLPFEFPFFGKTYNKVLIYADGFVKFENTTFSFPYLIDSELLFRSHKMISVFQADLTYGSGKNVTFGADLNTATIVWRASVSGQVTSNVNVALKLHKSGKVELFYGSINMSGSWRSAVSGGDVVNYYYTSLSNNFTVNTTARKIELIPPDYPAAMNLTEDGLFTATPDRAHNTLIKFSATDNNNVTRIKDVLFRTYGLTATYTVDAGGDTIVHAGDTVLLSVKIKNIGTVLSPNTFMKLTSTDTTISILDNMANLGAIPASDSIVINQAFAFVVHYSAHDGHYIDLNGLIISATDTFASQLSLRVNTFLLTTGNVNIADGNNNILEPNETAAMMLEIKNIGGATATNLQFNLSTADPYITLNPAIANIDTILPYSSKNAFFIITTAPGTPSDHLIVLNAHITGQNSYSYDTFFFIQMGSIQEDYETGDFTAYDWTNSGNLNWYITDSVPYQGTYAARSGKITHNQNSSLTISQYVLTDGQIRFHRKVSSERDNTNHNYDYLAFFIDGAEQARWDGDMNWEQMSFPVSSGQRTFKWTYVKDYSVDFGADCAWIDNIIFPVSGDPEPDMQYNPNAVYKSIMPNTTDTALVQLYNNGTDLVLYAASLELIGGAPVPWASLIVNAGGLNEGQQGQLVISFDGNQLLPGNYECRLRVTENFLNDTIIPIYLTVQNNSGIDEHALFKAICYPNPSSGKVNFKVSLHAGGVLSIRVFDYTGRLVNEPVNNQNVPKGEYLHTWDALSRSGEGLPNGLYFCEISVDGVPQVFKLILAR